MGFKAPLLRFEVSQLRFERFRSKTPHCIDRDHVRRNLEIWGCDDAHRVALMRASLRSIKNANLNIPIILVVQGCQNDCFSSFLILLKSNPVGPRAGSDDYR